MHLYIFFISVYFLLLRKLIPLENLTAENVLHWRCLCEYLKSKGEEGEDLLEQMLPEPAIYADYLLRYIAFKTRFLSSTKVIIFEKVDHISVLQLLRFLSKPKICLNSLFSFFLYKEFFSIFFKARKPKR